jgi:hypothetical protein
MTGTVQPVVTTKRVAWETSDGETCGLLELGDDAHEFPITGRIRPSTWTTDTN